MGKIFIASLLALLRLKFIKCLVQLTNFLADTPLTSQKESQVHHWIVSSLCTMTAFKITSIEAW